jgi:Sds3-like
MIGEEPLSPPTTPQPMSKRHQKASSTLAQLTHTFNLSREPTFIALLNRIQTRLTDLHEGNDEEYRQQLALLEDQRDKELLEVEAGRGFALQRIEREYQEEKRLADKEFQVYTLHLPGSRVNRRWEKRK